MKIIAAMIVKNEERVIARCLASLVGVVDMVCICDTGSTDDTVKIIQECSPRPPVEVYNCDWVDFATNRNISLEYARDLGADWILLLDADNTAEGVLNRNFPQEMDAFKLNIVSGDLKYTNELLLNAKSPWEYVGVLHEHLTMTDSSKGVKYGFLTNLWINDYSDGGERKCIADFNPRWDTDILTLEGELRKHEPGSHAYLRALFYIGRTHDVIHVHRWVKDKDDVQVECHRKQAIESYSKREAAGGWVEERYYSLYRSGILTIRPNERMGLFLRAWGLLPHRWEAAFELCLMLQAEDMWDASYAISKQCLADPPAKNGIFMDMPIYEYKMAYVHAAAAFHCGFAPEAKLYAEFVIGAAKDEFKDMAEKCKAAAIETINQKEA